LILFAEAEKRRPLHFVWAGLSPVLLLSGERKALVIYLILTALLFARGRLALIAPALAAAFVGLLLLSTVVENPYLQKQMRTLVEPGGSGNYEYVLATGRYLPGDTPSDVQRAFALHVSSQMFAEHPLFGVGTNQYETIVGETYPNAPGSMRLAIHGEFQRILTENGLIGFFLYLLIWVAAWVRLSRVLRGALDRGRLTRVQARVLPLLLFIPLALFVGTEASGTRAFIGVIVISLLPELVSGAFAQARTPMPLRSGLPARPKPALQLAGGAS
jgi:O-antigen ligase